MERNTLFMLYGAVGVMLVLGSVSYLNMTAQDNEVLSNCNDGTLNMQCSDDRPLMCVNGELIENVSICGLPEESTVKQNASDINASALTRVFSYILKGEKGRINLAVDSELNIYLANISRKFACIDGICPTYAQMEHMIINESKEKTELDKLVSEIKGKTSNKDDQARIAISLVQNIPYDTYAAVNNDIKGRYPYEVIFDVKGVCGEKSRLLAYLLKELGFGVALLSFEPENHMAVGIECPTEYSYKGTGYCFVETTTPSIITDSSGTYGIRGGKLVSAPNVIVIGEGMSFDSVSAEYQDAQDYTGIFKTAASNGSNVVDNQTYLTYRSLLDKYGIQASS